MAAITRKDIEEAVTRFTPNSPSDEYEAFVNWNAKSWEGEDWDDAGAWNLSNEWVRFGKDSQSKGHWYTR
jgi:hypothetical protein